MRRTLIVMAALLLLGGCAVTSSTPPGGGLSSEEEAEYARVFTKSLAGSRSIEYVPPAGWGEVIAGCMNAAGYAEYVGSGSSISNGTSDIGSDPGQQEALDTCLTQYPILPDLSGSINLAQLDYLYDYFRDFLIPCLTLAGHPMRGEVPTREEFVVITAEPHWHPYRSLAGEDFDYATLFETCPPSPFAQNVNF